MEKLTNHNHRRKFNFLSLVIETLREPSVRKDIEDMNNTIKNLDLVDKVRTLDQQFKNICAICTYKPLNCRWKN